MIETFTIASILMMAVNFFRMRNSSLQSLEQRFGHLNFYFFVVLVFGVYLKILNPEYNLLKYEYAKFELNEHLSFAVAVLLRGGIYLALSSLFYRNYRNKIVKLVLLELLTVPLMVVMGVEFNDLILSSFVIITWSILTIPQEKNSKITLYEQGNVVKLFSEESLDNLSLCPIDRAKNTKVEIAKGPLNIGLRIYLLAQFLILTFVIHSFLKNFDAIYFEEKLLYIVYFVLTLSSLGRMIEKKKLVMSELLRHLLFLLVETSYWDRNPTPIEMRGNLSIVVFSFISLNWYLVVNSQEVLKKFKKLIRF